MAVGDTVLHLLTLAHAAALAHAVAKAKIVCQTKFWASVSTEHEPANAHMTCNKAGMDECDASV